MALQHLNGLVGEQVRGVDAVGCPVHCLVVLHVVTSAFAQVGVVVTWRSTHKAAAISLSLVIPDLAVNCTWYTEEDCLGSDHLPIITELNENIKDDETDDEDTISKFQYKHADWEAYQAFLLSSDINSIVNEDLDIFYSNCTKTILLAAEHSNPRIKHKKLREQCGNP